MRVADNSHGCSSAAFRAKEVLDARYEVLALHGRGVFSTVVRAADRKAVDDQHPEVAIKIIRSNDTM